ncbi:unnamed protein product [Owenia fusiformis]|uniref:Uncharacterized protein n=1 Tax=Owenia fusiformis TaxID=6347 RepID=A0A8J1U9N4_OWEFU|nr:unnamed protein product [Owenia fusiformis]
MPRGRGFWHHDPYYRQGYQYGRGSGRDRSSHRHSASPRLEGEPRRERRHTSPRRNEPHSREARASIPSPVTQAEDRNRDVTSMAASLVDLLGRLTPGSITGDIRDHIRPNLQSPTPAPSTSGGDTVMLTVGGTQDVLEIPKDLTPKESPLWGKDLSNKPGPQVYGTGETFKSREFVSSTDSTSSSSSTDEYESDKSDHRSSQSMGQKDKVDKQTFKSRDGEPSKGDKTAKQTKDKKETIKQSKPQKETIKPPKDQKETIKPQKDQKETKSVRKDKSKDELAIKLKRVDEGDTKFRTTEYQKEETTTNEIPRGRKGVEVARKDSSPDGPPEKKVKRDQTEKESAKKEAPKKVHWQEIPLGKKGTDKETVTNKNQEPTERKLSEREVEDTATVTDGVDDTPLPVKLEVRFKYLRPNGQVVEDLTLVSRYTPQEM